MKMKLNSDQLITGILGKKLELSYDTLIDENDTKFWSIDYRDVLQIETQPKIALALRFIALIW